ncbi:GNAT family N-acetyltransferase [Arthrobacter sp. JZ12]|uniref:GNAT family N-acetyltransferase n=1 Tax=Arthrobacter sp. JZ12 TaxID=2654190 RepID=UPI002B4617D9|nr:GNAT family N-acetyltransferase [Arthrobacter sp. JZ12]WRH25761.1 GNAT family N-acetyltransferase [Arthrobacter sp. JZ12]
MSVLLTDQQNHLETIVYEPTIGEYLKLAQETREDSYRVLTVITNRMQDLIDAAEPLGMRVTDRWQALMSADMEEQDVEDPLPPDDVFTLHHIREAQCRRVSVTANGEEAARGSVARQDGYAVFDRIVTEEKYRRRGLGSFVMRALTADILEEDVDTGLLMASADGRHLYQHLGWTHLADVFVIRR